MKYLLFLFLIAIGLNAHSQETYSPNRLIQVSGIVKDADSSNVLPYVSISSSGSRLVYAANYQGYFSFVAKPGDTLTFTAVGYKEQKSVIPLTAVDNKYTLMMNLKSEIYVIQAVRIYPWATVEEFTHHFLNMKIADDDLEIARKNLDPAAIRHASANWSLDSKAIGAMNSRYEHDRALNRNMVQTNPFLNPFAWGRLIQSITKGDKSRGGK